MTRAIHSFRYFLTFALFAGVINFAAPSAVAQGAECAPYFDAVAASNVKIPAIVPDKLLQDSTTAITCLVAVVRRMAPETGPNGLRPETAVRLLSATAALRTIMTRGSSPSDATIQNASVLNDFISKFRGVDDVDVVSVLAYGVRNDMYDLRLNSVLILGNIIDNTTVCVPLAHLNDPSLLSSPYGINGRANLLGIVSVVAPWAYRENYDNITRTVQALKAATPQAETTIAPLSNIESRLTSQTATSNRREPMPSEWRRNCATYVRNFIPKIENTSNVSYSAD
jgi:hypothetical protein